MSEPTSRTAPTPPQRRTLRTLLASGEPVVAVECLSAITALQVQDAGFPVAYIGGSGLGNFHLGIPDHGLITTTEMTELAGRIAAAIQIPLLVDGDQGGETALNTRRTVRALERAGVAGVHLEDTVNPKHLLHGDRLVPVEVMRARIAAAVEARTDGEFVIIARTDELFNGGSVAEAIRKGIAYAEAGADAFMCLRMTEQQVKEIGAEVPIPLADINHQAHEQERSGLRLNIHTGQALPVAVRAYRELLRELREAGRVDLAGLRQEYELIARLTRDGQDWVPASRRWQQALDDGAAR